MKRSEQGQEEGQRGGGGGGGGDTEEIEVCLQQVRMGQEGGDSDQLHADLQRRPRKNVCLLRSISWLRPPAADCRVWLSPESDRRHFWTQN